jgi:hypothetical protein
MEMKFVARLRARRIDRDAAFDAALREGRLPARGCCPYCGRTIRPCNMARHVRARHRSAHKPVGLRAA